VFWGTCMRDDACVFGSETRVRRTSLDGAGTEGTGGAGNELVNRTAV